MLAGGRRPGAEQLEFFSMRLKRWHGSSGEASGSWGGVEWSGRCSSGVSGSVSVWFVA